MKTTRPPVQPCPPPAECSCPECRVQHMVRATPAPGKLRTQTMHPGPWLARTSTCVWFYYSEYFHWGLCAKGMQGMAEMQRKGQGKEDG